jgi:SAM-dependent methyltransferase
MQKKWYEQAALRSVYTSNEKIDHVVGSYEKHNEWKDYDDYLMKYVDNDYKNKIALDFGCGPCRNIIKYHNRFARIDGCDISPENLENGKKNLNFHKISIPNLYSTNGDDLGDAQKNYYDFIFSTIALQHICVHEIRFSILKCMYNTLKNNGRISIQMGFGIESPNSVGYFENYYEAPGTNRTCDTRVEDPYFIQNDLSIIGFKQFEYWIRPVGPGDNHPNWIFFTAVK